MKQIIIIRKDLKMRRGKEIAQSAHASMKATLENINDDRVKEWLNGIFTKITVTVNSEQELLEICNKAKQRGLITSVIKDNGKTEFRDIPTITAGAIGPATDDDLVGITDKLKLY